jgi:antitoxin ParD1/3/4
MLYYTNYMIIEAFKGSAMSTTRKTITLTEQQNEWIKAQINAGNFTNDSEYIRDLIRRDQSNIANIEAIRAALVEGEESGEPQPFDAEQFKLEMAAKYAQKQN